MGKRKPKLAPLTPDQEAAVNGLLKTYIDDAQEYVQQALAYTFGVRASKPKGDKLDADVKRVTDEWLDALGLRAEEVVMEPFDAAA